MLSVLPGLGGIGVSAVGKAPWAPPVGCCFSRGGITETVWLEGGWERRGVGDQGASQLKRSPGSEVGMEAGGFVTDSAVALSLVSLY